VQGQSGGRGRWDALDEREGPWETLTPLPIRGGIYDDLGDFEPGKRYRWRVIAVGPATAEPDE